jgi:hypothetical protein
LGNCCTRLIFQTLLHNCVVYLQYGGLQWRGHFEASKVVGKSFQSRVGGSPTRRLTFRTTRLDVSPNLKNEKKLRYKYERGGMTWNNWPNFRKILSTCKESSARWRIGDLGPDSKHGIDVLADVDVGTSDQLLRVTSFRLKKVKTLDISLKISPPKQESFKLQQHIE